MKNKISHLLLAIVAILALAAWYNAYGALQETRSRAVTGMLEPAMRLLEENQALIEELQSEAYTEKGAEILESYLASIRRDGVPKHAAMRQRLERIAENNVAIMTLLDAYKPHSRTPGLQAQGERFHHYAEAWRGRWNSVMEVFMAGGNYAIADVPFPRELLASLQAELKASR